MSNTSITPSYFKNKMNWKELEAILSALEDKNRSEYEKLRMVIHSIYQVNSTKNLKPTDVLKFSWDSEEDPEVVESELMSYEKAQKLINSI